jgi:hypothetical protein
MPSRMPSVQQCEGIDLVNGKIVREPEHNKQRSKCFPHSVEINSCRNQLQLDDQLKEDALIGNVRGRVCSSPQECCSRSPH